jgi:hypothetical protein
VAAERGDSVSQNLLGWMYFNGEGVKKNDKEAVKWMQMAAIQGNPDAQAAYAYMLFYGRGTRIDQIEAGEWYLRAARQGNEDAREYLGPWPRLKFEVELLVSRIKRAVGMC